MIFKVTLQQRCTGSSIKKDGGMLHYHETTPESLVFDRPMSREREAALRGGRPVEIKDCREVKKYSPGVWHIVDAWINLEDGFPQERFYLNKLQLKNVRLAFLYLQSV